MFRPNTHNSFIHFQTPADPAQRPRVIFNQQFQITKGQFRRALDQAGLTTPPKGAPVSDLLTQKEVEMLSRRYEVRRQQGGALGNIEGEGAYVNYFKLCEQIEKVR